MDLKLLLDMLKQNFIRELKIKNIGTFSKIKKKVKGLICMNK